MRVLWCRSSILKKNIIFSENIFFSQWLKKMSNSLYLKTYIERDTVPEFHKIWTPFTTFLKYHSLKISGQTIVVQTTSASMWSWSCVPAEEREENEKKKRDDYLLLSLFVLPIIPLLSVQFCIFFITLIIYICKCMYA